MRLESLSVSTNLRQKAPLIVRLGRHHFASLQLPIFAPGEQAAEPKGFTDFNDLATKSVLGREGIERQVRSVVDDVIERYQAQGVELPQQVEKREHRLSRAVKVG